MNANVQPESDSTDLELIGTALQNFDRVSAGLALLEKNYKGVLFDVETSIGMDTAKAARAAIRDPRYEVERVRKSAKAPLLALGKRLDAEATRITNALLILEEPIDRQIKTEESRKEQERLAEAAAKAKRTAELQARVDAIRSVVTKVASSNQVAVGLALDNLLELAIDDSFGEFRQQAEDAKGATVAKLRELHAAAVEREAEQERIKAERAELQKLREEAAERDAIAAEERRKQEALDKAAREAEAKRLAEQRAEIERQEREARGRQVEAGRAHAQQLAAEKAQNDRIAEEQRQVNAEAAAKIVADREALEREAAALRAVIPTPAGYEQFHESDLPKAAPLELSANPVPVTSKLDSTDNIWWSDDGERYDYQTLGDLIDCRRDDLEIGSIVHCATAVYPDPTSWVSAEDIIERLANGAGDEHGEWAEDYPDVSNEAKAELQTFLDAWIQKYAQPRFFNVKDHREYVIAREDLDEVDTEIPW